MKFYFLALLFLIPLSSFSQSKPIAIGSPLAKKGGTFISRFDTYPKSLNYFTSSDVYSGPVAGRVMEVLVQSDAETLEPTRGLAKSWILADDKLSCTYILDERAKFSDGTPLTADDIIFTFDTLFNEKNNTAPIRSFLDALKSWEKIDAHTVKFHFNRIHFQNIERVGGVYILQKSFYGVKGKNFNEDFNFDVTGSGPYLFDKKESQRNRKIVLKRNKNWWGLAVDEWKNLYNFDKIVFDVIKEDRVAFESLKKGTLDWMEFRANAIEIWVKETQGKQFEKDGNLVKFTYPKAYPSSWGGVALNMRHSPLSDLKFRQALQYLYNRPQFIEKLFYNLNVPIRGPWGNFSPYASPNLKVILPDEKKAKSLLDEAGFKSVDDDGILYRTRDGKKERAELKIMFAYQPHEKYLTIFKEDAKKVGVKIDLQLMEWAAAMKLVNEFKFDAFVLGWAGDPTPAPSQLWASKYANEHDSSNLPGFSNKEFDNLMYEAEKTFETEKRYPLFYKMEEMIVAEQPYIWSWQQKDHLFVYNKTKIAMPDKIYKYSGDAYRGSPYDFWWSASLK